MKIMKTMSKLIPNERLLMLINSNRFRGAIIALVTWFTTQIKPGFFEENVIAEMVSYIIYSIAGITASIGQIEASDRRYSEKEQRWKKAA